MPVEAPVITIVFAMFFIPTFLSVGIFYNLIVTIKQVHIITILIKEFITMYTIQEVANKMNVAVTTLRYYAKEGIFPYIQRDANNNRLFDEKDLGWVHFAIMLRKTGMSMKGVKEYEALAMQGDITVPERYTIVKEQHQIVVNKIAELNDQLILIELKMDRYERVMRGETVDGWNPQTK
jgi:DNA-binding transcriptional MerR regulator